jgi:hypothetical protein
MKPITVKAVIDENHRLIVDLPDDVPVGPVELVIMPERSEANESPANGNDGELTQDITREEARKAAGGGTAG